MLSVSFKLIYVVCEVDAISPTLYDYFIQDKELKIRSITKKFMLKVVGSSLNSNSRETLAHKDVYQCPTTLIPFCIHKINPSYLPESNTKKSSDCPPRLLHIELIHFHVNV